MQRKIMAKGARNKNIMTILLIFLATGAFWGIVGRDGASSVVYFLLSFISVKFAIPFFLFSLRHLTGLTVAVFEIIPYLFYPLLLCVSALIFMFFTKRKI